ncbi:MAG: alpha/beta fold hydrolase [Pseudomonadota bacterium]
MLEVLQRRTLIKASAAGLALGSAPSGLTATAVQTRRKRHFVLVHGTWHGGWCWQEVADRLRAQGHMVTTPTLTGCGERRHLIGPEVGLDTHVTDILNAIEFAGADTVTLIGHSFSGITITGVADALRERINHLVFFDALIPTAERRAAVMRDAETGEYPEWWLKRAAKFEDGYKMSFWEEYDLRMLVPEEDAASRAKLKRYLTWHPAKQWTDELQLKNGGWEGLKRTCIHAVGQTYRQSSEAMVGPGREPGWNFVELDVARDGFLTDPRRVAEAFAALD